MPRRERIPAKSVAAKRAAMVKGTDRGQGRKPGKTRADIERTNLEVVRLRLKGLSWPAVGEQVGLKEGRCKQIWSRWREEAKPFIEGLDPLDYVTEMVARYDQQYETLAEMAYDEKTPASARVGAVNAQRAVMESQATLLQETGMLPRNLGKLQVELDVRYLAVQLAAWAKEVAGDDFPEHARRLQEILHRSERPPLEIIAGG